MSGNNLFTLRYANWPKDLFMGVMPNSQLGDVSVVDILPTSSDSPNLIGDVVGVTTGNINATGWIAMNGTSEPGVFNMRPARTPDTNTVLRAVISNPALQASFSVLQPHSYSSLIHRYVSYFPVFSPRFFGIIPVARRFSV